MSQRTTNGALRFDPAFEDGDAFYAALVDAIDAAGDECAPQFLSRLVLVLANQIGREDVLAEAIKMALEDVQPGERSTNGS
ncbi:MAG: DUF2783 domain-containing protein [Alphaproteobacteria bacterium]|jgi:Protein of unknown function (DUF2783)|nr:DUF2783 domain-containing protein [Alphaproteobacteria bacterium]